MDRAGHIGAAFLVYTPLALFLTGVGQSEVALVGASVTAITAIVPDYDRHLPITTGRGLAHTVWFAFLVGLALAFICGLMSATHGSPAIVGYMSVGFLLGSGTIGSHLVVDALTPPGIQPFEPFSAHRYTYSLIEPHDQVANYLLLSIGSGAIGVILVLGITV